MKSIFEQDGPRLVRRFGAEQLLLQLWGANSLRVRVTHRSAMETEDWALLAPADSGGSISISERGATIRNGRIEAIVTDDVEFIGHRHGTTLLREYVRRRDTSDPPRSPLKVRGREFRPLLGGEYEVTVRFESDQSEQIFGMGQYQHEFLDLKGCTLELAQRNSQASVPFAVSSLGYGFLWRNAVGRVTFAKNLTEWHVNVSRQLDYWVTAGDRPADIVEAYALATGTVPLMPEWATGLWQSKLRYQTQEELLAVAREHTRRGLPLTVIAADFFHWRKQGDWAFDPEYWPDPAGMVRELRDLGIQFGIDLADRQYVSRAAYGDGPERLPHPLGAWAADRQGVRREQHLCRCDAPRGPAVPGGRPRSGATGMPASASSGSTKPSPNTLPTSSTSTGSSSAPTCRSATCTRRCSRKRSSMACPRLARRRS